MDPLLGELMNQLGICGSYQCIQFTFASFAAFNVGMHIVVLFATAPIPEHKCHIPESDSNHLIEMEDDDMKNCYMFDNNTQMAVKCDAYIWSTDLYAHSRTIDWKMVCDDKWKRVLGHAVYMLGALIGCFFGGFLSDHFGRKAFYSWSSFFMMAFAMIEGFTEDYNIFLIVRFLLGCFGSGALLISSFVMVMELAGQNTRALSAVIYLTIYSFGKFVVALWGYLVKDPNVLQLLFSMHSLLLFVGYYIIDESPRWLWRKGRTIEAIDIVKKGYRFNGWKTPFDYNYFIENSNNNEANFDKVISPVLTGKLQLITMVIFFNWFTNGLIYFSILYSIEEYYVSVIYIYKLMAFFAIEICGYLVALNLMFCIGRRTTLLISMITSGFIRIFMALFLDSSQLIFLLALSVLLIITTSCSFGVLFVYTAELYNTIVRNSGMGIAEMGSLLGAVVTLLIIILDVVPKMITIMASSVLAILAGALITFLPETKLSQLPETYEDIAPT